MDTYMWECAELLSVRFISQSGVASFVCCNAASHFVR